MSAVARYRAANWMMWLLMAVFISMIVFGVLYAPLSEGGAVLFVFAFFALFLLMGLCLAFAAYAFLTVRCGECEKRFFDLIFLTFPVQGGCKNCHAPIGNAYTVKIASQFAKK